MAKEQPVKLFDWKLVQNQKSYIFNLNKMFNYFLIAPSNAYSLSSLPTEVLSQSEPKKEPQVSLADYTKLLERYDNLKAKYDQTKRENVELKDYVSQLEDVFHPDVKRKKIRRRTEGELSKDHSCPYPLCKKEYASPLALNLHIRSKHDGGTKKERLAYIVSHQKIQKELLEAEENGLDKPETKLRLCPELLESEIRSYRQKTQHVTGENNKVQVKENASSQMLSDE